MAEQVFRYNNRTTKDNPLNYADHFMLAVPRILGKRLPYSELTGKVGYRRGVPQSIDSQKVLSLSEIMKRYSVFSLALRLQTLESCYRAMQVSDSTNAFNLGDDFMKTLGGVLSGLKTACEEFGADSSLVLSIDLLAQKIANGTADLRPPALLALTHVIIGGVHDNLSKRSFMLLSEEEAGFYGNPNVFGESFKEKYPARAMRDVFDAGNCYAASVYTACVFHCMRVAEYGLRKLAANRTLRIKLTKKGRPCAN